MTNEAFWSKKELLHENLNLAFKKTFIELLCILSSYVLLWMLDSDQKMEGENASICNVVL